MSRQRLGAKRREWLARYLPAELLGTAIALVSAWHIFSTTHSYAAATATGWVGEGVGFYGYFVTLELLTSRHRYRHLPIVTRVAVAVAAASTNLLVEFLPAELLDNFLIRPGAMYLAPQYIHPYPVGFLVGKLSSDLLFYALAIVGYELRKRWLRR
ncbi:MAG: hypothetical protein ACTHK1_13620 [Actinomycetales bacterium]